MTDEQNEWLKQIRKRHTQQLPSTTTMSIWNDVDFLLSLVDGQAAESKSPLCAVHKSLDERDDLVLEIGNDCVACSLNERSELLNVLEPLAKPDGTQDSLTVLNNSIKNAATLMRSACIEKVRQVEHNHLVAADAVYERGFCDALKSVKTALKSITIQEQERQMSVKVTEMTNEEALEDVAMSLANEVCEGACDARQTRIRKLLIELANEIKRQAIEP